VLELRRNAFPKQKQLGFWDGEQRSAASEADSQTGEHRDNGLIKAFTPGEMDDHLRAEVCLFF
jgi:hypothetical protein